MAVIYRQARFSDGIRWPDSAGRETLPMIETSRFATLEERYKEISWVLNSGDSWKRRKISC